MNCAYQEEQAYRFVDGSLEPQDLHTFAEHLADCAACRDRVAAAERLEGLLTAAITPLAAPAGLVGRVAQAVAAERERRPRFAWPRLFGRRLATVAATLLLAVGLVTVAAGPESVLAVVQRALFFVPGVGISAADGDTLVAANPVSVTELGATFSVEALLADGEKTEIRFKVTGLPGGKQGWERDKPAQVGGKDDLPPKPQAEPHRLPVLRDAGGREYGLVSANHGTGGSPQENHIEGGFFFAPLPADLTSVELVVPLEYLVPPTVLAGADSHEWALSIPLVHPAQGGLPQAVPQGSAAAVHGITLRVQASTVEGGRTVVLVEGEAPGADRVVSLVENGANASEGITLRDSLGRTYKYLPNGSNMVVGGKEVQQSLHFEPLGPLAGDLTLTIAAVMLTEEGEAETKLSLAGRRPGETFALDRTVDLGGHKVLLKSATLVDRGGEPWLLVDVDLGERVNGRLLSAFNLVGSGSSLSTYGAKDGAQMDRFGLALASGQTEVTLRFSYPLVSVEGPWQLTFPAGGK